jgi:hypothetical protein
MLYPLPLEGNLGSRGLSLNKIHLKKHFMIKGFEVILCESSRRLVQSFAELFLPPGYPSC